jgi:hypothetical protein
VKYLVIAMACAVAIVMVRAFLLRTLNSRVRSQAAARASRPVTFRRRVLGILAWPVFFVLVAFVVALSLLTASLIGPN